MALRLIAAVQRELHLLAPVLQESVKKRIRHKDNNTLNGWKLA